MIFERSDRFKHDEPERPALSYANFSEYLRQQFLNSRNMFVGTGSSRPQSARPQSGKQHSPSAIPARANKEMYDTGSTNEYYTNDFEDAPETTEKERTQVCKI